MAREVKYIPTQTDVTTDINSITIHTYYVPNDGFDIYLFISDTSGFVNGVYFPQGYEGVVNTNFDGDFFLDEQSGDLLVDSPYSDGLEIDDNGDLILVY